MERNFSSPNFDALCPRSNSTSRVPYYLLSATSLCGRRDTDSIMSKLPPLHLISTTHEVPCFFVNAHAVSSPTTVCNLPQPDNTSQATLTQIVSLLGSLGFGTHRQEAPQNAVQPPIYDASANAFPQPVPITTQTSLLMPVVPVDGAVANTTGQRLAQPPPPAAPATTNKPPTARPEWDPDNCYLLLKSANRPQFRRLLASASVPFWITLRTFWTCVGASATAGHASLSRGSARTKPRKYVVLIF